IITSPGLSANVNELSGLIVSKLKVETNKTDEYSITIVNNSGIVVKKAESNQPIWQTELGNLMPGSYVVQVTSKNGKGILGQCVFIKL
ncbi:MAG: T9SS type A sorting domain-containing protein, partial [Bacteroidota bacterium]|nr:T9SS type A sorting domain-containing protein [Bacteroidota bacterium]